ncbi:MAG TPA: arylsulfatase [Planctomycetota bacterium]
MKTSVLALALLAGAGAGEPPHVILIMTDDQGWPDLGCHGNPVIRTPNLDRLHAEGARFVDFHVSPTCAPTRASIMTGRHEFKSGVTHTIAERERLSLKPTLLPQALKAAGYATGIFGKWHLGDEDAYQPGRRGFDEVFIHGAGGIGQTYAGSCGDAPGNSYFNPAVRHNGIFEKTSGYCTDVFFGRALAWMEERKDKGRFFAYITPNAPHDPLDCPPEYEKRYAGKVPPAVAKVYGMIENIDDNVGRLLAKLDAWGIAKDTLVVFMTDNGTANGHKFYSGGLRGHKNTPYRGGTKAPSFWRRPGTILPGDRPQIAAHIDLFSTLAEIAGAKVPETVEGRSLVPALQDPAAAWPDRFLFTHLGRWPKGKVTDAKFSGCAVRYGRWNLVSAGKAGWELFDLREDPGETKDVAAAHPDVVAQIKEAYDAWWTSILPCLENEDAVGPAVNPFKEAYWKQFGK